MNCIMGVDPGLGGAIAFYFPAAPGMVSVEDMPVVDDQVDGVTLTARVEQMRPDFAFIEAVGARPGQGVSSMFKFGRGFGTVIGVVNGQKIPFQLVSSTKWKKALGLDSDKEKSRRAALERWPARAELFSRKKDDGRAEAALIALYGAQKIGAQG